MTAVVFPGALSGSLSGALPATFPGVLPTVFPTVFPHVASRRLVTRRLERAIGFAVVCLSEGSHCIHLDAKKMRAAPGMDGWHGLSQRYTARTMGSHYLDHLGLVSALYCRLVNS
jgi:hypothetical protein